MTKQAMIRRLVELGYRTTADAAKEGLPKLRERLPILMRWASLPEINSQGKNGLGVRMPGDLEAYKIASRLAAEMAEQVAA